jgi:hypothetical protein
MGVGNILQARKQFYMLKSLDIQFFKDTGHIFIFVQDGHIGFIVFYFLKSFLVRPHFMGINGVEDYASESFRS